MTRTALALLAVAGAFLLAGGAQAKAPPDGIDVCGASACVHLEWTDAEQLWTRLQEERRPVGAGPFYVLRWRWPAEPDQTGYFIPGAKAIRWAVDSGRRVSWNRVDPSLSEVLTRAAPGVEPYPTPIITRVTVGGRQVRAPQTYLRLLEGRATTLWPAGSWLTVKFESAVASPWTDGGSIVRINKRVPYVEVDGWVHRIPKSLAVRARRGLALGG
jgi:hypothetical protein